MRADDCHVLYDVSNFRPGHSERFVVKIASFEIVCDETTRYVRCPVTACKLLDLRRTYYIAALEWIMYSSSYLLSATWTGVFARAFVCVYLCAVYVSACICGTCSFLRPYSEHVRTNAFVSQMAGYVHVCIVWHSRTSRWIA